MPPETLDPQAVNLAKAIRQTESGGNFNARGKSGEYGAYQFTLPTWQKTAPKYGVNAPLEGATKEQQNEVAYKQIKEWKDAGYNVGQIASMWNAGEGKPNAYIEDYKGVNKYGVKYDVPAYAKSVATAYQTLKQGGQVGMDPNNPSSISGAQVAEPSKPSVGGFIGNVFKSGGEFLGGLGHAVTHPIETISNIANLGAGAVEQGAQKFFDASGINRFQKSRIDTPESRLASNVGKFYGERYGGVENIKKTLYEDPVGAAADASVLLGGGAGLASKAGLVKTASGLGKVASAVDPIANIGRAGGGLVRLGGRVAGEALGAKSGVGYGPIREAVMDPQSVAPALRGRIEGEDVLASTRQAIGEVKRVRGENYRSDLAALADQNPGSLDISPLVKSIDDRLKEYKIGVADDGLDFSRSPVSKSGQRDIQEAIDMIKEWGSRSGDRTPETLHVLQQKLGDIIPSTGQARAFITSLKSELTKTLNTAKGFPEMQARYAQDSNFIDDLNRSLDAGNTETAVKKLSSLMRRNNDFKIALAKKLEEATGEKILGKVAGMELRPIAPRGLTANIFRNGEILLGMMNPQILPLLLTTSPRLIGEVAVALGVSRLKLLKILEALKSAQFGPIITGGQRINAANDDSRGLLPSLLLQNQRQTQPQTQ